MVSEFSRRRSAHYDKIINVQQFPCLKVPTHSIADDDHGGYDI